MFNPKFQIGDLVKYGKFSGIIKRYYTSNNSFYYDILLIEVPEYFNIYNKVLYGNWEEYIQSL